MNTHNSPAPLLEDIDITFEDVNFNGSFFKDTKFQLAAGPEVDAAWQSLGVDCKHALPMLSEPLSQLN